MAVPEKDQKVVQDKQQVILPSHARDVVLVQLQEKRSRHRRAFRICTTVVLAIFASVFVFTDGLGGLDIVSFEFNEAVCPQADVLTPQVHSELWESFGAMLGTEAFKARAIDWLANAVKIPTEIFDEMPAPPGSDHPAWKPFNAFHEYLLKAYPLIHANVKLTKVNTYGLIYEWAGSDESLKPYLLTAHQDVVPVLPATVDEWEHPPYSGYFDGLKIWGRGSSDDKSGLISIMNTLEVLLEKGFKPTRGIVLAFGFDEESSGTLGAGTLGPVLLEMFGENGLVFIVDEGGGFSETFGAVVATPGIAEKGSMDVKVEVHSPGGHSSVPPSHTTIGILGKLLTEYEANPFKFHLTRNMPLYHAFQCYAQYGAKIPPSLRSLVRRSAYSKAALRTLEKILFEDKKYKSLVTTTAAIDMISGGVKSNALPEEAWAIINHRISLSSSVEDTQAHDIATVKGLAERFNLTFNAFGQEVIGGSGPASGSLGLEVAFGHSLQPAPVTPFGTDAVPYQFLSGTIKGTYNAHRSIEGVDNIIIAPGMPSGNTDTKYYWKLTRHIFRYNHGGPGKSKTASGAHTTNEYLDFDAYLEKMRFFSTLILNADESAVL
ncbi:carboxypeptidase S [Fistulina hepatica ATCC 64428]|uniref:Carboxypeptidase S n=1 Tax=Fistulina hepatica ATCC 64428 TaxID=1128425 RepID=A0A0D7AK23_9AGAR|nr:carboxypeptidase S [Fistulina hepatica ATCC 64428]